MGKVIPFPYARIRRLKRRRVDVFSGYFEITGGPRLWDRLVLVSMALGTLLVVV